jgi:hypothetical protein
VTKAAPRLIVANLLAEDDLERLYQAGGPRRLRPPSASTLQVVARMGRELAVFGRPGDRLWVPGDPPPEPAAEVLAWCETPQAAALRTSQREGVPPLPGGRECVWERGPGGEGPGEAGSSSLKELLWHLPVPAPEVVAQVHHRAFALRVAEELGCALPGSQIVDSPSDLDHILSTHNAPAAWVVKAPFSASGRSRYIERNGPRLADLKARRTVENLFERHGPLLVEPWLDRVADWGCAALLTADGLRIVGIHRQQVDVKGQFAGIDPDTSDLPPQDRERLEEVAAGVADALRQAGYVGPFGIDAWHWRRPDGSVAFHSLGEINARMTFGLVAWARLAA